jgi:transposase
VARELQGETATTTLGAALGVEGADEDDLYEAMDWLLERQARIEKRLAAKHLSEGSLVLYDLSSSYYTGSHCSLARFGHNRDRKKGFPQINYGLLCNREGIPVATEVFPGDQGDPSTLGTQIEKIRNRFHIRRVIFVGDRGMITDARLEKEIKPVEGLDWITALRAPAIKRLAEQKVLQPSLFDKRDLAEIESPDFPGERLIACYNPLLGYERTQKREDLLQATERELEKVAQATRREKRALRGKDRIGLRVGRVLHRFKMGKHFKIRIAEESFSFERNEKTIRAEEALDGIYIIRTSVPEETMGAENVVKAYKGLDVVERAFRSLKTLDLKVRPIYHRKENRVRAHIFLCMLAYYVEWHMKKALAPILFQEDDPEGAESLRRSIVAPAQRSEMAKRKARTKKTKDGLPVMSFQGVLKILGSLVRNRIQAGKGGEDSSKKEFELVTTPNRIQRKALDLLGVSLLL